MARLAWITFASSQESDDDGVVPTTFQGDDE